MTGIHSASPPLDELVRACNHAGVEFTDPPLDGTHVQQGRQSCTSPANDKGGSVQHSEIAFSMEHS